MRKCSVAISHSECLSRQGFSDYGRFGLDQRRPLRCYGEGDSGHLSGSTAGRDAGDPRGQVQADRSPRNEGTPGLCVGGGETRKKAVAIKRSLRRTRFKHSSFCARPAPAHFLRDDGHGSQRTERGKNRREADGEWTFRDTGRNVIDKTGFTGTFDVHLQFARDEATAGLIAIRGSGCGPAQSALDPTEPSVFTALQEQLGLRLESTKGPVEVLVIDHAETPSEN